MMSETIISLANARASVIYIAVSLIANLPIAANWATLPGNRTINDLELTTEWQLEVAGEFRPDAEIYHSPREVAYLVVGSGFDGPLLVSPRGRSVQSVDPTAVVLDANKASLQGGSGTHRLGSYTLHGKAMRFQVDSQSAELKPRPPLLGTQAQHAVVQRSHSTHEPARPIAWPSPLRLTSSRWMASACAFAFTSVRGVTSAANWFRR